MNDLEFHGRLRGWLRSEAPAEAPDWLVDAVLDATATAPQQPMPARWTGRWSFVPALIVVALLVVAGVATLVIGLPSPAPPSPTPRATVVGEVPVGTQRLLGIAHGPGGLWVASSSLPGAVLIDPATGERRAEVQTNEVPPLSASRHPLAVDVIVAFGSVWTVDDEFGTVTRIGPSPPHDPIAIDVGDYPRSAAAAAGAVWVLSPLEGTLVRIDPETNQATPVALPSAAPGSGAGIVAGDERAVWVALDGELLALDPRTEEVLHSISIGAPIAGLAVGDEVWVTSAEGLTRIDPVSGRVEATDPIGASPGPVAAAGGLVWVADIRDGRLRGMDPSTGEIVEDLPIGRGATDMTVSDGALAVLSVVDRTITVVELAD